ncbi:hypothetical protein [Bradyrhizobium sp. SYSU BS000235]|uniref:hypothetical protein n=1 Tax=Bradyrhizobium sp. SYSU BS000235 TaxID=3411332 RepID=UPI003C74DFC4
MTDHNADGEISAHNNDANEASLVPDSTDMVLHPSKGSADKPSADHKADAVRLPKDIVLQRLSSNSSWEDFVYNESEREKTFDAEPAPAAAAPARRSLSMAAVVAIAASVGAVGGALATVGVGQFLKDDQKQVAVASAAAEHSKTIENAIAKLNADISSLKSGNSGNSTQAGKLADRIEKLTDRVEKVEKAQAEPAAKLAKLSEAVDKLRAAEATASVAPTPAPAPAAQPNRLPIVDGWVLRQVLDGAATVQGRQGIFEVIPGDPLPGVGRVDAIRRQDGRWVVVTSRGLIVAR